MSQQRKQAERKELEALVSEFLAQGGQITQCSPSPVTEEGTFRDEVRVGLDCRLSPDGCGRSRGPSFG